MLPLSICEERGKPVDSEELFRSQRFIIERLQYETAEGTKVTKDVVRHPGSVAIVPLIDEQRICLIRNRRVTVSETLVEIPAGTLEPPESPLECAQRELIEETGYQAEIFEELTQFFPAPGILDEKMHLFVARKLTAGQHAREDGEEIENLVVELAEALQMIGSGEIHDAKTMLGLLLYARSKQ